MSIDDQDRLWFGSATSELFKLDGVSKFGISAPMQTFTQADGLSAGPVDIFNIDGEAIFSNAGRLLQYIDGELRHANLAMFDDNWLNDSLIIDQIVQIPSTDSQPERIWYRKNGNSGYFEKLASGQWTENTYIFDSVEAGGFNSLFMTDNDILWFVRDKAEIYRVNVPLAQTLPASAPLNIRRLDSNGQLIAFKGEALQQQTLLSISPEQSDLRFSYASTDNSSPAATEYRTRLSDNANTRWSQWSQETYRDYTQLPPRQYRFELEARDAWGRITSTHLDFIVLAPWYLSKVAYTAYILLSLVAILAFAWFVQKWRTAALEEANRALEHKVAERTKEVSDKVKQLRQQQILKDRFFGNVSHEFRTPLTLTIGPLETIISEHKSELTSSVNQLAQTALSNASRMLALVGQVLDMNRLEAGKLPLRIAQYDLAELLRNTGERFQSWAQQQEQDIEVINCEEPMLLWFDIDQLDKCISNLLSNAIKYSGKGSRIQIQLLSTGDRVLVQIRDNGAGISKQAKDKVFERFYQDKSSENISAPGTGIGLALVKELMQMHHGDVQLLNNEGSGCCFELSLQKGNQHFEQTQIIEPIAMEKPTNAEDSNKADRSFIAGQRASSELSDNTSSMPAEGEDLTTLLIVDDNKELLNFISLRLSASYRILQADNGLEGYEMACKELPDLIVSDVNMPIMTGLELAQKIKGNADTRTIPVILLTAKATKREVVAGFSVGADDYLTKPFDTSELIMRVNAQINARKLARESQASTSCDLPRKAITFEDKLFEAIHEQLADPSFNAERLAVSMHMSRDTLIRKCKKARGETPLNLITEKRMQKADELLKANAMSISEVAYACGFESLAYFSKRYKKYRGMSPSEVSPSEASPI
jgi:signal transduction histidine kinase/DNA-binding response OmpR family regulator